MMVGGRAQIGVVSELNRGSSLEDSKGEDAGQH